MFAGNADGRGEGARLRSPLALPSAVTVGPGPARIVFGTERSILSVGGLPGQSTLWNVSISGANPPSGLGLPDSVFDVVAVVSWQIGNTRQTIEADLPAQGLSFPLAFDFLNVAIRAPAFPALPPGAPDGVEYQAAISTCFGGQTAAVLHRSIRVTTPATVVLPRKASRVQLGFAAGLTAPPATAILVGSVLDFQGTTLLEIALDNTGAPTRPIDLPGGASTITVGTLLGAAQLAMLTFEINP
jgi:hypothetical protein